MNLEGRFTVRPNGHGQGDLIIGTLYRSQKLLKPGIVYELSNILDTLTIKECGVSVLGDKLVPATKTGIGVSWYNDVNSILSFAGKYWMLTRQEYLLERLPIADV